MAKGCQGVLGVHQVWGGPIASLVARFCGQVEGRGPHKVRTLQTFVVVLSSPIVVVLASGLALRTCTGHGRGDTRGVRLPTNILRVGQLVVLFPFHTSILKPDLDLPL